MIKLNNIKLMHRIFIIICFLLSFLSINVFSQSNVEELSKKEARNEVKRLVSQVDSLQKFVSKLKTENDSLDIKLKIQENELIENKKNFDVHLFSLKKENQDLKHKIDSISNHKSLSLRSLYLNSILFKIDTTYKILIGNRLCKVIFVRENYDKRGNKIQPLSDSSYYGDESIKQLLILDFKTDEILYIKRFEYEIVDISSYFNIRKLNGTLLDPGKVYLDWYVHSGGSGYAAKTYSIDINDNEIEFEFLFSSGELSNICYLNNQFIVIDGIWNFEEKETHFDAHRCEMKFIKFENYPKDLITIKKYNVAESTHIELLKELYKNEITLKNSVLKYTDIEKYSEYKIFGYQ